MMPASPEPPGRPKWYAPNVSPADSAPVRLVAYVGSVYVVLSVALPKANVYPAAATRGHWILPCQCETSMPLAYGVAAAAPLDTAAASTSTVTTLLARDPTATTLDNAMFGLGKRVGSRSGRTAVQTARCAGDSEICRDQ